MTFTNLQQLNPIKRAWIQDNPIMMAYLRKGYFESERDIENLHQFHSPYIVPKGLTKLQVRRRINRFRKDGNKNPNPYANTHRVEIFVDGKFLSGTTYGKPIENHRQFLRFLRELHTALKAPKKKLPNNF